MSNPTNLKQLAKQKAGSNADNLLVETPVRTLKTLIEKKSSDIATILGGDVFKFEKFKSNVIRLFTSTDLKECSPLSVLGAAMQAAYLNLDLDPNLGQAYVLSRWNSKLKQKEATFQTGYQGLLELCRRSGKLLKIESHIVWINEKYEYFFDDEKGTVIKHFPLPPSLRGEKRLAVYFVATLKGEDGNTVAHKEWLWAEEIEIIKQDSLTKIKEEYRKYSPWMTSVITEDAMWKKTSIRRGAKYLPKTTELEKVLSLEIEQDKGTIIDYTCVVDGKEPLLIDPNVQQIEPPIVFEKEVFKPQTIQKEETKVEEKVVAKPAAPAQKLNSYQKPQVKTQQNEFFDDEFPNNFDDLDLSEGQFYDPFATDVNQTAKTLF